jgi:hypothetical protein
MSVTDPPAAAGRRDHAGQALDPADYSALLRLANDANHRLVVSFGGGSVPGLSANVALARILEELGLRGRVAEIWGTSAGAIVGGGWASGTPALDILRHTQTLDRPGSLDVCWFRLAMAFLLRPFGASLPDGLVRGRHFFRTIAAGLTAQTFEDCEIPFRAIACSDDGQARRKIFRSGPLLQAIVASMSLPGILMPPRDIGAEGYYDGGLVEKTPLISPIAEHARSGDPRKLLLLCSHFGTEARKVPAKGFVNRFLQTIYAMEDIGWAYQHAEARGRSDVVMILLDPHLDDPSSFDFTRVRRNYEHAREVFLDLLQNAKLALSFGIA